jgi:hypothetical protein
LICVGWLIPTVITFLRATASTLATIEPERATIAKDELPAEWDEPKVDEAVDRHYVAGTYRETFFQIQQA